MSDKKISRPRHHWSLSFGPTSRMYLISHSRWCHIVVVKEGGFKAWAVSGAMVV
jgi:hypothetical protein